MNDDEFDKLMDQFDSFLKGWEKEYNKKNSKKVKKNNKKELKFKPYLDDIIDHMSLQEIEEYLKDDPELTNYERFDLYYEERERIRKIKERKKQERNAQSLDKIMKDLDIKPSDWKSDDENK